MTEYSYGDYDTTVHGDENECCETQEEEWGFICTREPLHEGNHAAGDGVIIQYTWENNAE